MRRALEEDQYSALGSIVDTDSSDDGGEGNEYDEEDHDDNVNARNNNRRPRRSGSGASESSSSVHPTVLGNGVLKHQIRRMDRNSMMSAMRRHMRIEGLKSVRNFDCTAFLEEAEDYLNMREGRNRMKTTTSRTLQSSSPPPSSSSPYASAKSSSYSRGETGEEEGFASGVDGDFASDGRRIGKRRKKKKRGKTGLNTNGAAMTDHHAPAEPSDDDDAHVPGSGNEDDDWEDGDGYVATAMTTTSDPSMGAGRAGSANNVIDDANMGEEEEISIFGQTAGAINATWVECDRCKKVSGNIFWGVCPDTTTWTVLENRTTQ